MMITCSDDLSGISMTNLQGHLHERSNGWDSSDQHVHAFLISVSICLLSLVSERLAARSIRPMLPVQHWASMIGWQSTHHLAECHLLFHIAASNLLIFNSLAMLQAGQAEG